MDSIHRVGYAGHHSVDDPGLTVHIAAQRYGVLTVLSVEHIQIAEINGLDQNDIAVKFALLVGNVDHIVHKCPQEIAFPKLYDLDGPVDAIHEYDKYMSLAEIDTLRFVVSNTTEAGIVYDADDRFEMNPPKSFPGKLTKFLYHRFETFQGDTSKGLVMLPVELIDDNGIMLKKCVMQQIANWGLSDAFKSWIEEACVFTATLVDRIVTGYPRATEQEEWEKLGYEAQRPSVPPPAESMWGSLRQKSSCS